METLNNYQQEQITGKEQQTVIIDSSLTAETDELDPKFGESDDPRTDPDNSKDAEDIDGEGIEDDFVGEEQESDNEENDDIGLNHDEDDDLSLNT